MIEKPWRRQEVPLPVIANHVVHPSYLSLEWALQYYDLIPEYVPNPTSITTGRGMQFAAQKALFLYYHVQPSFFMGYRQEVMGGFKMNIAYPEKALLDKIYLFLQRNPFSMPWFMAFNGHLSRSPLLSSAQPWPARSLSLICPGVFVLSR